MIVLADSIPAGHALAAPSLVAKFHQLEAPTEQQQSKESGLQQPEIENTKDSSAVRITALAQLSSSLLRRATFLVVATRRNVDVVSSSAMLLVGVGASAAAGAALVLPMLLYYHFVDRKKSNAVAALTFCCTLTFTLLLALLVPIDIMYASSTGTGSAQGTEEARNPLAPSVTEAAAAAHASNASSAFTPAGAAAAAAAAAGWAALKSATLPLTPELLQRMYFSLSLFVFMSCFLLTPAAIFYANESNKRRVGASGMYLSQ